MRTGMSRTDYRSNDCIEVRRTRQLSRDPHHPRFLRLTPKPPCTTPPITNTYSQKWTENIILGWISPGLGAILEKPLNFLLGDLLPGIVSVPLKDKSLLTVKNGRAYI